MKSPRTERSSTQVVPTWTQKLRQLGQQRLQRRAVSKLVSAGTNTPGRASFPWGVCTLTVVPSNEELGGDSQCIARRYSCLPCGNASFAFHPAPNFKLSPI